MWNSNYGQFATLQPPKKADKKNRVKRGESFLSRGFSALVRRESMFNLSSSTSAKVGSVSNLPSQQHHHPPYISEPPREGRRLGRALSFKHPERISHIPPPEVTRMRSKSQARPFYSDEEEGDSESGPPLPPLMFRPPSPPSRPAPPLVMMMQGRRLPSRPRQGKKRPDESLFFGRDLSEDEDEGGYPLRGRRMARRNRQSSYTTTGGSSSTQEESFFDETLVPVTMVSRRKILSRSRDDLNLEDGYYLEEEDIWYQKEKLYRDHVQEVLDKWESIDDEIWAKVIVLERNRRVAKAYARAPVLTINGSDDGFDGFRIGVNGFDNPMRDPKTEEFKTQIGAGCKIKMDETGNIMIKRFAKSPVFVKYTIEENAVSSDVIKLPDGQLEFEKPVKLFDMKKFQQNVNRELKRSLPDRKKLECQCVAAIAFVKNEPEILDSPIWIMLINVVALEMLRAKMPPGPVRVSSNDAILNSSNSNKNSDPRKRFPASGSSDEDPYSLTPSGSSGSSGKGNRSREELATRLPPGEKEFYGPQNWAKHHIRQLPDYSDDMDDENTLTKKRNTRLKTTRHKSTDSERTGRKPIEQSNLADDPYYCGLRARVPAYVQQGAKKDKQTKANNNNSNNNNQLGVRSPVPSRSAPNLQNLAQLPGAHPFWWHSRIYPENELSSYHYPGRMRNQGYRNSMPPPISALAPAHKYRNNWD